jgi:hypothetical protein
LNGHARTNESKCKKCKKAFEICQEEVHGPGNTRGHVICSQPCSCGSSYYPDKAVHATQLPQEAWATTHPGYVPPEDDTTYEEEPTYYEDEDSVPQRRGRTFSTESCDPLSGYGTSTYQQTTKTGQRGDVHQVLLTDYDELSHGHEEDSMPMDNEGVTSLTGQFSQLNVAPSTATDTAANTSKMVEVTMKRGKGTINFEDPETGDRITFKEGALKYSEEHGYHYFWDNNTCFYTYPHGKGKGKETRGSSSQTKKHSSSSQAKKQGSSSKPKTTSRDEAKKPSDSKSVEDHPVWAYAENVDENNWTIRDTDRGKTRQVFITEGGHLYVEKKDGSMLYLAYD